MADYATIFDTGELAGDLLLDGPALAEDSGLTTAAIHSLFADARALDTDDVAPGETDRRGWWGDIVSPDGVAAGQDRYGSRLWLLARGKQTRETLNRARGDAFEALQWLIDDGIANAVTVNAEYPRRGVLAMEILIDLVAGGVAERHFEIPVGA